MATSWLMPFKRKGTRPPTDDWLSVDKEHSYKESREPQWKSHPATCLPIWQGLQCYRVPLSPGDQSVILNSAIDKLYDNLATLIRKRNPLRENPRLEKRIASLFQCIKTLEKQEGDLVEEITQAHLSGPLARGWAILKDADDFMENYEHSSSANSSS